MASAVSGIERFMFGVDDPQVIDGWLAAQVVAHLGASLRGILFRAGRVDAVYGLLLSDGRRVVAKLHRPPIDIARLRRLRVLQSHLVNHGYPAAPPISGPSQWAEHVVSVEALLDAGERADPLDPRIRQVMAAGLVELVAVLRARAGSVDLGQPLAWARYHLGRWVTSHDAMFDFTRPIPAGWEFVNELTAQVCRRTGSA